ncbi:hypothetical protein [Labedella endophytica]|uniref:DUF7927 domain-containing protein n=1 Tax=Labedella endophytica TaxID=1523160 RepID=A0A3S0XQP5_9MICO|nr:hypothetical protein [Labedella endophytica]RUR03412.1 hypothetical protein ELQ94_02395 [Labedella endophytica]
MDATGDRVVGANAARPSRGRGRGLVAALAVGIGALALLVMPAGGAAAASPDESGVEVSVRMTASSDQPTAGDTVVVDLTLTNTGPSSERVLVDEVVTGVLDDARMEVAAEASSSSVTVIRLGHDRLALSGYLDPGQVVTVGYTVVIRPDAERGDGVLSRVALAADVARSCADDEATDTGSGLGDCTAIVLAGAPVESAGSTSAEDRAAVSAEESLAASARSSSSSDASGVSAAGDDGASVDAAVGPIPTALVVPLSVVLAALLAISALLVVVHRARRRRSRRVLSEPVVLPTRPVSDRSRPVVPVQPARATSDHALPVRVIRPLPPAVHFDSRRERRLAERRLAERGLALPVA